MTPSVEKRPFLWSAIGSFIGILLYLFLPMGNTALFFFGVPLFVIFLMKFPPMGPFMTELYPTAVRGTAQGFCYNAGRAIGALFPAMVGFLADTMSLGTAIAVFSALAFGVMIVMLLTLARNSRPQSRQPRGGASGLIGAVFSGEPRAEIQHQPQILHRSTRRPFAEIVEPGDEHGMTPRLVRPHIEIELVGIIQRLWFELTLAAAGHDRHVFGALVKGAQGLS